MITLQEAHDEVNALKAQLFVALGERRDARIKFAQAQHAFDGVTTHEQLARDFIQAGRVQARDRMEHPPEPPTFRSPLDASYKTRAAHVDDPDPARTNPNRRLAIPGGYKRGGYVR